MPLQKQPFRGRSKSTGIGAPTVPEPLPAPPISKFTEPQGFLPGILDSMAVNGEPRSDGTPSLTHPLSKRHHLEPLVRQINLVLYIWARWASLLPEEATSAALSLVITSCGPNLQRWENSSSSKYDQFHFHRWCGPGPITRNDDLIFTHLGLNWKHFPNAHSRTFVGSTWNPSAESRTAIRSRETNPSPTNTEAPWTNDM